MWPSLGYNQKVIDENSGCIMYQNSIEKYGNVLTRIDAFMYNISSEWKWFKLEELVPTFFFLKISGSLSANKFDTLLNNWKEPCSSKVVLKKLSKNFVFLMKCMHGIKNVMFEEA